MRPGRPGRGALTRQRMIFATPHGHDEELAQDAQDDPWSKPRQPVIARVLWRVLGRRKAVEVSAAIQLMAAQEKERTRAAHERDWVCR